MTDRPARRPHPLSRRLLAIAWDAHTVAGTLTGAVLLVILTTGTLLPFHDALHAWSEDATRQPTAGEGLDHLFDPWAVHGVGARGMFVVLPEGPGERAEVWIDGPGSDDVSLFVDGATGDAVVATSHVARDLEWLHYLYHLPYGFQLTGLLGIVATVSLITGVLIHLRDLIPTFGRLRRTPWRARMADLHALLGTVLVGPMLVFTLTGAIIGSISLSAFVHGALTFEGDREALRTAASLETWPEASGNPLPLPPPRAILERGAQELGRPVDWLYTVAPGDAAAVWEVGAAAPAGFGHEEVTWRQADGAVVHTLTRANEPPIRWVQRVTWALHFGTWGGWPVLVLYGLVGLASTALVASGLAVWRCRVLTGWRATAVDVSGVGATLGLTTAVGLTLLANRVVPTGWSGRPDAETALLFGAWALTLVVPWVLGARRSIAVLAAATAASWASAVGVSLTQVLTAGDHLQPFDAIAVVVVVLSLLGTRAASAPENRRTPKEAAHARA